MGATYSTLLTEPLLGDAAEEAPRKVAAADNRSRMRVRTRKA